MRFSTNFSFDTDVFIFLNYCYWVCKYTQENLFSPDCSFKICEKPSKFSKSVCLVLSVSAYLLTKCLHSSWLRWHSLRVVVDHANTVSAWSTLCPRSRRLCLILAVIVSVVFRKRLCRIVAVILSVIVPYCGYCLY